MSFSFEISSDTEPVKQILSTPACYWRMISDSAPPREWIEIATIQPNPAIRYVLAKENGNLIGLFLLKYRFEEGDHEVHFCFLPRIWGRSVELGKAFLEWVWENTDCDVLVGPVPSYNRLALKLALAVGFHDTGEHVASISTRRGSPFDLIFLSATRRAAPGARR